MPVVETGTTEFRVSARHLLTITAGLLAVALLCLAGITAGMHGSWGWAAIFALVTATGYLAATLWRLRRVRVVLDPKQRTLQITNTLSYQTIDLNRVSAVKVQKQVGIACIEIRDMRNRRAWLPAPRAFREDDPELVRACQAINLARP